MWEFSLNIKSGNKIVAQKIYNCLKKHFDDIGGFVVLHEENGYIQILVAISEEKMDIGKCAITSCIIETICNDYKLDYLNRYLLIPCQDKIGMLAFKKALLNFDIETDRFIVKKELELKHDIYLESFYNFKLKNLKDKWGELVSLANENRDYLLSDESFVDLLKFLVDNLDICEDEITIIKEEGGYRIYTLKNDYPHNLINEENIVSSVIDLSPQKINLCFSENSSAINLLKQIFDERISINKISFQNIKKIKLNQ